MGRSLKLLQGWSDCGRCPRAERRLGVVAEDWGRRPTVLVIAFRAHRVDQAVGNHSPRAETFAWELEQSLGLQAGEVVVDVLLACGLGREQSSDHVAACAGRYVENVAKYGSPQCVVLVGGDTVSMAEGAGLIVNGSWSPIGTSPVQTIVTDGWSVHLDLVEALGSLLGGTKRKRWYTKKDEALAQRLLATLGEAAGSASRRLDHAHWVRRTSGPLTVEQVARHLRGGTLCGPFRPTGPWPFVVIDADRHDALQAAAFKKTDFELRRRFPGSLFVESSTSGGLHVYVRLPSDVQYHEAATWLEAYFAAEGLLTLDQTVTRSGAAIVSLRSVRLEVPRHPVRLPFGRGSKLVHPAPSVPKNASRLEEVRASVAAFEHWLRTATADDFDRARGIAAKKYNLKVTWSTAKKNKLENEIERAHLHGLKPVKLPPSDPWFEVVPRLSKNMRAVATRGVPAMGLRTRCMTRLIDELFDVVEPDEVEELMMFWLAARQHQSEDIEADLEGVEEQAVDMIAKKRLVVRGVPVRCWKEVDARLRASWPLVTKKLFGGWGVMNRNTLKLKRLTKFRGTRTALPTMNQLVRQTAFFVLRRFFDRQERSTSGEDGERAIARAEFGRFLPNDLRGAVAEFFLLGGWLVVSAPAEPGKRARLFRLRSDLWPALPGEPMLFVPPP